MVERTDIINKETSILKRAIESWSTPEIIGNIPHGDMPGDKVEICDDHI